MTPNGRSPLPWHLRRKDSSLNSKPSNSPLRRLVQSRSTASLSTPGSTNGKTDSTRDLLGWFGSLRKRAKEALDNDEKLERKYEEELEMQRRISIVDDEQEDDQNDPYKSFEQLRDVLFKYHRDNEDQWSRPESVKSSPKFQVDRRIDERVDSSTHERYHGNDLEEERGGRDSELTTEKLNPAPAPSVSPKIERTHWSPVREQAHYSNNERHDHDIDTEQYEDAMDMDRVDEEELETTGHTNRQLPEDTVEAEPKSMEHESDDDDDIIVLDSDEEMDHDEDNGHRYEDRTDSYARQGYDENEEYSEDYSQEESDDEDMYNYEEQEQEQPGPAAHHGQYGYEEREQYRYEDEASPEELNSESQLESEEEEDDQAVGYGENQFSDEEDQLGHETYQSQTGLSHELPPPPPPPEPSRAYPIPRQFTEEELDQQYEEELDDFGNDDELDTEIHQRAPPATSQQMLELAAQALSSNNAHVDPAVFGELPDLHDDHSSQIYHQAPDVEGTKASGGSSFHDAIELSDSDEEEEMRPGPSSFVPASQLLRNDEGPKEPVEPTRSIYDLDRRPPELEGFNKSFSEEPDDYVNVQEHREEDGRHINEEKAVEPRVSSHELPQVFTEKTNQLPQVSEVTTNELPQVSEAATNEMPQVSTVTNELPEVSAMKADDSAPTITNTVLADLVAKPESESVIKSVKDANPFADHSQNELKRYQSMSQLASEKLNKMDLAFEFGNFQKEHSSNPASPEKHVKQQSPIKEHAEDDAPRRLFRPLSNVSMSESAQSFKAAPTQIKFIGFSSQVLGKQIRENDESVDDEPESKRAKVVSEDTSIAARIEEKHDGVSESKIEAPLPEHDSDSDSKMVDVNAEEDAVEEEPEESVENVQEDFEANANDDNELPIRENQEKEAKTHMADIVASQSPAKEDHLSMEEPALSPVASPVMETEPASIVDEVGVEHAENELPTVTKSVDHDADHQEAVNVAEPEHEVKHELESEQPVTTEQSVEEPDLLDSDEDEKESAAVSVDVSKAIVENDKDGDVMMDFVAEESQGLDQLDAPDNVHKETVDEDKLSSSPPIAKEGDEQSELSLVVDPVIQSSQSYEHYDQKDDDQDRDKRDGTEIPDTSIPIEGIDPELFNSTGVEEYEDQQDEIALEPTQEEEVVSVEHEEADDEISKPKDQPDDDVQQAQNEQQAEDEQGDLPMKKVEFESDEEKELHFNDEEEEDVHSDDLNNGTEGVLHDSPVEGQEEVPDNDITENGLKKKNAKSASKKNPLARLQQTINRPSTPTAARTRSRQKVKEQEDDQHPIESEQAHEPAIEVLKASPKRKTRTRKKLAVADSTPAAARTRSHDAAAARTRSHDPDREGTTPTKRSKKKVSSDDQDEGDISKVPPKHVSGSENEDGGAEPDSPRVLRSGKSISEQSPTTGTKRKASGKQAASPKKQKSNSGSTVTAKPRRSKRRVNLNKR